MIANLQSASDGIFQTNTNKQDVSGRGGGTRRSDCGGLELGSFSQQLPNQVTGKVTKLLFRRVITNQQSDSFFTDAEWVVGAEGWRDWLTSR